MNFPANHVMTRTAWSQARDKAGGSSGLTKVNLGEKLDAFHKAYAAAHQEGDESHHGSLVKAAAELANAVTSYNRELGNEHGPVQAITKVIEHNIETFTKEFGQYARHWETEYGNVLTHFRQTATKLLHDVGEVKAGLKRVYQNLLVDEHKVTQRTIDEGRQFLTEVEQDLKGHKALKEEINRKLTALDDHFSKSLAFAKVPKADQLRALEQDLETTTETIKNCLSRFVTIRDRLVVVENRLPPHN